MTTASWYHCSVKTVSRSAGRSAVATAAYRLGERLEDDRYHAVHDYTRKRGVECTFTVAPVDAPSWAHEPEALWNAAERGETRKNSTVAREVELALPSLLEPRDRQRIAEEFAAALVERYRVAVSVAIHDPGKGDARNYHAHILFTTREMTPEGLGRKTRILDDRKTGPKEVIKLRKLAADIINEHLAGANADIRVDHRSFDARGIEKEPTTHLGPAASEMERRGEPTERGNVNRDVDSVNAMIDERAALETEIANEHERITSPPVDPDDARERMREAAATFKESIEMKGSVPDIETDGLNWWQRLGIRLAEKARSFAIALAEKARIFLRSRESERPANLESDKDRGLDR